mgnify:CR=1 FL=1
MANKQTSANVSTNEQTISNTSDMSTITGTKPDGSVKYAYSTIGIQIKNNGSLVDRPFPKTLSADTMDEIAKERTKLQYTKGETYYLIKSYTVKKSKDGTKLPEPFSVGNYRPRQHYSIVI